MRARLRTATLNGVEDSGQHGLRSLQHIGIPVAKNREPLRSEPAIPNGVMLGLVRLCVMSTVEFHHDLRIVRYEIDDVSPER